MGRPEASGRLYLIFPQLICQWVRLGEEYFQDGLNEEESEVSNHFSPNTGSGFGPSCLKRGTNTGSGFGLSCLKRGPNS
jgi:hypothetical protein